MWILSQLQSPSQSLEASTGDTIVLRLRPSNTYTVGRRKHHLNVGAEGQETSISRNHAQFRVGSVGGKNGERSELTLEDSSTHGTWVSQPSTSNFVKIKTIILAPKMLIRFGKCKDIVYRIDYIPVQTCLSGLSTQEKQEVDELCPKNEVSISQEWQSTCTHLITNASKITAKPVLALVSCASVVTLDWLKALDSAQDEFFKWPNTETFLPRAVDSPTIHVARDLWKINPARQTLFRGISFVILNQNEVSLIWDGNQNI
jgi:hypothetical protein